MFGKKKKKTEMDTWREEEDQPNPYLGDGFNWSDPTQVMPRPLTEAEYQMAIQGYKVPGLYPNMTEPETLRPIPTGSIHQFTTDHTWADTSWPQEAQNVNVDKLWDMMYEHAKAVITVCQYCGTPGLHGEKTCSQCGAPLHFKFLGE